MKYLLLTTLLLIFTVSLKAQKIDSNRLNKSGNSTADIKTDPVFPGGIPALLAIIRDNLRYPTDAMEKRIQGQVYIEFTIGTNGKLSDYKIVRSPSNSLTQEGLRILKGLPKWKPATLNQIAVQSRYGIPINFTLNPSSPETKGVPTQF